jgi:hypothetical protein
VDALLAILATIEDLDERVRAIEAEQRHEHRGGPPSPQILDGAGVWLG